MVKSMTAFARQEEKYPFGSLMIEIRSVNHRFLELNVRMPDEFRSVEMKIREQIKKSLKRGKMDISIHLKLQQENDQKIGFNHDLAEQVAKTLHEIDKLIYNAAPVNAIDVLNWPGVLDRQNFEQDVVSSAIFSLLDSVLHDLHKGKEREGQALQQMIEQRSTEMRRVITHIRANMPEILQSQRERLEEKLLAITKTLSAECDTNRLEQEMVYIAQKADVAEEVDRLDTHLDEIKRTMDNDEAIGRRLDFLMQELNREANTLGSKSISKITTQASVDMKVLIEQMREQIQNIE